MLMAADNSPQPQPQLQPDLDEPDRQSAQRVAGLAEQGDAAAASADGLADAEPGLLEKGGSDSRCLTSILLLPSFVLISCALQAHRQRSQRFSRIKSSRSLVAAPHRLVLLLILFVPPTPPSACVALSHVGSIDEWMHFVESECFIPHACTSSKRSHPSHRCHAGQFVQHDIPRFEVNSAPPVHSVL